MSRVLIVIPARWGSTRLPGKPLVPIAGKSMLQRVVEIAVEGSRGYPEVEIVVATDDTRIQEHAEGLGVRVVMTPVDCSTGSDRALAALRALGGEFDAVLNVQGDTPLTPPTIIAAMVAAIYEDPTREVITPVVPLSWAELDTLRAQKATTPFSGTTVIRLPDGRAAWFSKQILPAMRNEEKLRAASAVSPVYRHIGIYSYRTDVLERYVSLGESFYEKLEGLEQLRALEHGMTIHTVIVHPGDRPSMSGVDSAEDVARAEALIAAHGEVVRG